MWGNHMFDGGAMGLFGLGHLLWWALLIAGVILLARWLLRGAAFGQRAREMRALSILKERYARGEIDKAEFDARRRDIES